MIVKATKGNFLHIIIKENMPKKNMRKLIPLFTMIFTFIVYIIM